MDLGTGVQNPADRVPQAFGGGGTSVPTSVFSAQRSR